MKKPESINFFHTTSVQIRFNDLDTLGHINNSVFQQYFDLGRIAYFKNVLNEQMDWNVEGLILASISIDFLTPIRFYDSIVVHTKINHLGNKSLKMIQDLFDETTEKVAATGKSIMVSYNNTTGETLPIPGRWRKCIAAFEKDTQFQI